MFIGEIRQVYSAPGELRFEWKIQNILSYMKRSGSYLYSPRLEFCDRSWNLKIVPFDQIELYLAFWSGTSLTVRYALSIKRADGTEGVRADGTTRCDQVKSVCLYKGLSIYELLTQKRKLAPSDALTVTCHLSVEIPNTLRGRAEISDVSNTEQHSDGGNSHVKNNSNEERRNTKSKTFISCESQTDEILDSNDGEGRGKEGAQFDTEGAATLSGHLKAMLLAGQDHDVTIQVKDREFRAHKNILRARSSVFASMFAHNMTESSSGAISVEDCEPEAFGEFLRYVYSGKTENLSLGNALGVYYAADKYDFPVLKKKCVHFMETSLSTKSICDVIHLAAQHGETKLLECATDYFARNVEEILITVEWQRFMKDNSVEANELYIKCVKSLLHKN